MFEDVLFRLNQITDLKIIANHITFLTIEVGKKIPSNKINILIFSKNLYSSVGKYFSEFSFFFLKSLIWLL
jgi:hypothetical protein